MPSYVFIGPRGGHVPIRLALLAGIESEDLLSTNAIVKLFVELDIAPLLAQDFALFGYPIANPERISACHRISLPIFGKMHPTRSSAILSRSLRKINWMALSPSKRMNRSPVSKFRFRAE